jgi:hypothetical protein
VEKKDETKEILNAAGITLLGLGLIAFHWWYAYRYHEYYYLVCFLGPILLVHGFATLAVPEESLEEPPAKDPESPGIVTKSNEYTMLGKIVFTIGLLLGAGQMVLMDFVKFR